ncbi:MAG: hypothetical protein CVU56_22555 [Deltaproteobacteria bacterium HGW-Deltaproteobacteria-14]|jgi:FtsP/CotA-like multicopper oxidase with cupredoxin domain|nr:MAG: hypothetical protein CVU56_22555 [Deltaproteobacteria bacterium HGW-Deltaproteobacteria-14]
MNRMLRTAALMLVPALALLPSASASASVFVQCPGDTDGDAIIDHPDPDHPHAKCMHLAAGDGYAWMADGSELYVFGFHDVTGVPPEHVMMAGMLAGQVPAPTITLDEGDELYLTVTNVGMVVRSDLNDPHTVHFHGFPNAASVFDGVPDASLAVNMMSSYTYYYHVVVPGTFMYHCHVEATEHMQMGMLGNLYVRPRQNRLPDGTDLNGFTHHTGNKYVFNDGDGSTRYDVEFPIQLGSFDAYFHVMDETFQPPPFAALHDDYALINGRGYPDTVNPNPLPPSATTGRVSQQTSSLITVDQGQRLLLRISNLNVTRFYTVRTSGLPLLVVGIDAKPLRGPTGVTEYYTTHSLTTGGGQAIDAIIDTTGVPKGTYFLYTSNLNYLSNSQEDFGGMMTEIIVQ